MPPLNQLYDLGLGTAALELPGLMCVMLGIKWVKSLGAPGPGPGPAPW